MRAESDKEELANDNGWDRTPGSTPPGSGHNSPLSARKSKVWGMCLCVIVCVSGEGGLLVCWLLNVQAICECISGTDLLRQFYVLSHGDRNCRSNFSAHPVTVY